MNEADLIRLNQLLQSRIERRERQQRQRVFGAELMLLSMERTRLQVAEITKGPDQRMIESARRLNERKESHQAAFAESLAKIDSDLSVVKLRTEALRRWRDSL